MTENYWDGRRRRREEKDEELARKAKENMNICPHCKSVKIIHGKDFISCEDCGYHKKIKRVNHRHWLDTNISSNKELFISILIIFTLLSIVSATPITLYNLSINTSSEWCVGQPEKVSINPVDMNNTTVSVDDITILVAKMSTYALSSLQQNSSNDIYSTSIIIKNSTNLDNMSVESFTLIVEVVQNGKRVNATQLITLNNNCDNKIYSQAITIDEWLQNNWISLLVFVSLILFLIIVVIVIKLSKR